MAYIIGFAREDEIDRLVRAGYEVEELEPGCADEVASTHLGYKPEDESLIRVCLDIKLVDLLDCGLRIHAHATENKVEEEE